jgi:hypothetical protein
MNAGTDRRTRELAMRQGIFNLRTRASRQRRLPTKNGHAGSARACARVIREYQSDSSSKRPAPSSVLRSCHPPGRKTINDLRSLLDWGRSISAIGASGSSSPPGERSGGVIRYQPTSAMAAATFAKSLEVIRAERSTPDARIPLGLGTGLRPFTSENGQTFAGVCAIVLA